MRKILATLGGAAALLAVTIPALASWSIPEVNGNVVVGRNTVVADSSTGDNLAVAVGEMKHNPCFWGGCSISTPVVAKIRTGASEAVAVGQINVGQQENGCCDEGCQNPCWGWNRCGSSNEPDVDLNLVVAGQTVTSTSRTGFNTVRAIRGSGEIVTGSSYAGSDGRIAVTAQTNDVVNVQVNGLMD